MKIDNPCKCHEAVMDEIYLFLGKDKRPEELMEALRERGYKVTAKTINCRNLKLVLVKGVNHLDFRERHRISLFFFPGLDIWNSRCKTLRGKDAATT